MLLLNRLVSLWRNLFHKDQIEQELKEELSAHLEMLIEIKIKAGLEPVEARRTALIELGGVEQVKESIREVKMGYYLGNLYQDLQYSMRMLLKKPGFTIIAILTLSIGIGANTAMFSVTDAVLLRSLPFNDPDKLLSIRTTDITRDNALKPVSYPAFLDWRSQSRTLEKISVWRVDDLTLTGRDEALHLKGGIVSANLFSTLGVTPILGRDFNEAEDKPANLSAILSYELWRKQFNSDTHIIGQTVTLGGNLFSIIGVMPKGFNFPIQNDQIQLWVTIAMDALPPSGGQQPLTAQRGISYLNVIARQKSNVSLMQVQADLGNIQQKLNRAYPENRPKGMKIVSLADEVVGDMRTPLLFLFGAVALMLTIACTNVANLLLTRFAGRQKEFAIRSALGATRGTLIRQLLIESVLLSCTGGIAGLLLIFFVPIMLRFAPSEFSQVGINLNLKVFGFAFAVAILTGLLFGLIPTLSQVRRNGISTSLKTGDRGTGSVSSHRARSSILFAQVMLSTMLLSISGILLNNLVQLININPGFSTGHVTTFGLSLPARYEGVRHTEFYNRLLDQIRQIQGIRSASIVQGLPMGSTEHQLSTSFAVEGQSVSTSEKPTAALHINEYDYFRTMGIPLISGRNFTEQDNINSSPVIIINQTIARQVFKNEDPVGKVLRLGVDFGKGELSCQIVGIIGDVRSSSLGTPPVPELYIPLNQFPVSNVTVVIRNVADSETLISQLRHQLKLIDKDLPMLNPQTMEKYVDATIVAPRFSTLLLGVFAILSLTLMAVGLYGVLVDSVVQRTREIGIRMALGAQRMDIVRLLLREGLALVVAGSMVGLGSSLLLGRIISRWIDLYKVTNGYLTIYSVEILLLIVVVLCVSIMPAIRASRIAPAVTLRQE